VIETVELAQDEAEGRTVVVAVGRVHAPALIDYAIKLATAQSKAAGIPYQQLVVFHLSDAVTGEQIHRVERGAARPSQLVADADPSFTALSELAPAGMRSYLVVVPPVDGSVGAGLAAAVDALVDFQERHRFTGHMVLVGARGDEGDPLGSLIERLDGSTLIPVPLASP